MAKPPPSYHQAFPERAALPVTNLNNHTPISRDTNNPGGVDANTTANLQLLQQHVENLLQFTLNINVITVPVMNQLLSSDMQGPVKQYMVLDAMNGGEILQGLDISGRTGNPNIRGITLALPPPTQQSVLHLGYLYSPAFSRLEFTSPTGVPVGVFQREGLGSGFICPCLVFCGRPMAQLSVKNPVTGETIFVGDAYVIPRKYELSRPPHLGGSKIGSLNLGYQNMSITLQECASPHEKLLLIGLAVGLVDFEQLTRARHPYGYGSNTSHY